MCNCGNKGAKTMGSTKMISNGNNATKSRSIISSAATNQFGAPRIKFSSKKRGT